MVKDPDGNDLERMRMSDLGVFTTLKDAAQFILSPSLIKAKDQNMEINAEGYHAIYEDNHVLLTVTAGATALIPLSVNIEKQCRFKTDWFEPQWLLSNIQNTGIIFEGNMLPIYRVLDVTDVDSAQKTIISSVTETFHQNPSNDFRLDVGKDLLKKENINKHFYRNTCNALKTTSFDEASIVHQGTWKVRSEGKGKNKRLQFTKDPEHSLSQEEDMFIVNMINELVVEHKKKKKR